MTDMLHLAGSGEVAEKDAAINVAVVCDSETSLLAGSLEALLAGEKGFRSFRFEYRGGTCRAPRPVAAPAAAVPDVVVVTLGASPADDRVFESLQRTFQNCPVLVAPVEPEAFDIFEALQRGAVDFLLPPFRRTEVLPRLKRQARLAQREDPVVQKRKEQLGLRQIVGEDPAFLEEVQRVPRFARCDATVLISGESGTGKEIFARAIHYLSPRADRPFVPVNCGALPETLMESEIFGHKRGAFTGATMDQPGLIREAEGGTLFLDEIDGLTRPAQVKLLRFLQNGEYRSVGSQQILHANIRVVAAANADFSRLVRQGSFREDLFYRLNVLTLALPALRERRSDIVLLAHHILEAQAATAKAPAKKLSLGALNRLLCHSWPGNVRELENVLTRAVVLCDRDTIELADLNLPDAGVAEENQTFQMMKARAVQRFEHDLLETTLRAHQGNITRASRAVKKNRRAFWELLRKHGLLPAAKPE